jgi:hypothetical protein
VICKRLKVKCRATRDYLQEDMGYEYLYKAVRNCVMHNFHIMLEYVKEFMFGRTCHMGETNAYRI